MDNVLNLMMAEKFTATEVVSFLTREWECLLLSSSSDSDIADRDIEEPSHIFVSFQTVVCYPARAA